MSERDRTGEGRDEAQIADSLRAPAPPEPHMLLAGVVFGESPRLGRDGRLWVSDWGAQEILAVDPAGNSDVIAHVPSFPFCFDWLPDGRLLIVSASDRLVLRRERDGSLVAHTDLSGHPWNEIVVEGEADDRCPLTGQHTKRTIHQGSAGSALSRLYRSRGFGCLACPRRHDRRSPSFRPPRWWWLSNVAVLSPF